MMNRVCRWTQEKELDGLGGKGLIEKVGGLRDVCVEGEMVDKMDYMDGEK